MQQDLRFWGVVVKPGETFKCDPGELYYHLSQIALEDGKAKENVEVFVKTDDKRIMLCTLSVDNDPHFVTGLVFKKKFELLHSSMNSNICFTGYKFEIVDRYNTYTKGDNESDQEVPLLIPLDSNTDGYKNNEATHGSNKLTAPRPVDAPPSIPKATVEEPISPPKPKGDDKDKTDAHNPSDSDDIETFEDVDYPQKKTKGLTRPVETPLKTPQGKKAKIETPSYVHVATPYPLKQASKTSGYVHVATPYPAKHARKEPESKDKFKQFTPHVCGSCSRTFGSPRGLKDHSKAKHGAE
ncbi:histone deacetylase HDT2 isoform X2 [Lolium perenne]|uniref:histone deacetylase HDT2 isoform X2 n=1 Tax=Lolium perenne TaxID=4522 RepID=UPI0021F56C8D|nr:histone deacetylase HDT2-like isoform X2 [Lolium perenne]